MPYKKQYIVVVVLVVLAVVASLLLVPGTRELALMQLKDKHFEEARKEYEKQAEQGTLTLEVANNLTNLYLQVGAIDKAIEVMEKFIKTHPDNLDARTKLGTLYQYAQRQDDYLRNLEEINKSKPRPENLKILSDIYNFKGDYEKQAQALRELIATEKGKNPEHFIQLANILASRQDYAGAIAALRDLQKTYPDQFNFQSEVLLVNLLFDNKQPEDGFQAATGWVEKHPNPTEGAELINIVHFKGNTKMADTLIGHYSDEKINESSDLLEAFIFVQLSEGKDDAAYQRLYDLYKQKKLPRALNAQLLILVTQRGDKPLTHELLKDTTLSVMSETQLLTLVELAGTQKDPVLLAKITMDFEGEEANKLYPGLAAALAVANHQSGADVLLARLDTVDFPHEESLQVATICVHHERYDCTNHLIERLPEPKQLDDAEVANVGELYLKMHEWEKGYKYIKTAMETHKSLTIDEIAMQFAAAHGDEKAVTAWIAAHPDAMTPRLFNDLYYSAFENHQTVTAIRIAELYHDKYNNKTSRKLLADAYMKSGKYELAVKFFRENRPLSQDEEDGYVSALIILAQNKPEYHKELVDYVNNFINVPGASLKEKESLAYNLLDHGYKNESLPIFTALASSAPADSKQVQELLYIWGPRPYPQEMKWLEGRYAKADGKEKKRWAVIVSEYGSHKYLIGFVGRHPETIHTPEIASAYFEALAENGQLLAQQNYYLEEARRTGDTTLIHEYTDVAQANGYNIQTQKIYEAILAMQPENYVAMRQAGVAEFDRANYSAAKNYLTKYINRYKAQPVADPEAYLAFFYYAEILRGEDDMKEALPNYRKTLQMMEGQPLKTASDLSVKAQAQIWSGDVTGGLKTFDDARQQYPGDRQLRSDLTTTFINIRQYEKAQALLKAEPKRTGKRAMASATPVPYSWVPVFATPVRELALYRSNHELLVRFARHLNAFDIQKVKNVKWISYTSDGWDTLLITTAPGYHFEDISSASYPDNTEGGVKLPHKAARAGKRAVAAVASAAPPRKSVKAVPAAALPPEPAKAIEEVSDVRAVHAAPEPQPEKDVEDDADMRGGADRKVVKTASVMPEPVSEKEADASGNVAPGLTTGAVSVALPHQDGGKATEENDNVNAKPRGVPDDDN